MRARRSDALLVEDRRHREQVLDQDRPVDARLLRLDERALPCGERTPRRPAHQASCPLTDAGASSAGAHGLGTDLAGLELGEEAVDDAALAGLVVQRLADDAAGQVGRQPADLAAQRHDGLLALGLDLLLGGLGDPRGLGLGLAAQLGDDRRTLLARLLADARGLGAGLGELRLVLLERRLGLRPGPPRPCCMPPSMAAVRSA